MPKGQGLESLIPPREDGAGQAPQGDDANRSPEGEDNGVKQFYPSLGGEAVVEEEQEGNLLPEPIDTRSEPRSAEASPPAETEEKVEGTVFQIEIDKIKPNPQQPRKHFDEITLRELATSIREFGVLQPIIISKVEGESETGWSVYYELVTGERRLMAAKMAGLNTVPAIIHKEPTDREKLEMAVIENIQRADLNAIEFARAVARLQDEFGLTQREIATRLGKSREAIANSVRLLSLPTEIQNAVAEGRISESHARLLLSVDDTALQTQVFEDIIREKLNVREADARIKRGSGGARPEGSGALTPVNPEVASLRNKLEEFLGTKVGLQGKGASGKITISFYSPEELEAIVDKVTKQNDNQPLLPPLQP